jgi:serine protease Do
MDLMNLSPNMEIKLSNKKEMRQITRVTLIALVVGVLAGVIGAIATENYLYRYAEELQEVSIPLRLAGEKPRPLPGTYEEAVEKIRDQVAPSLVRIYPVASTYGTISQRVYEPDDAVASGVIVTSDGWLVTSGGVLNQYGASSLMVVIGREVFAITETEVDEATDLILVKVEANNLPVLTFGASSEVQEGDLAFVVPARNSLVASSIQSVSDQNGVIHTAEELLRYFVLADELSADSIGAPVTNSAGELIGFVSDINLVRPLHHAMPAIESILRDGEVTRPFFGASIIDLASAIGLSDEDTQGNDYGAMIVRDPNNWYVSGAIPGSPADDAGLLNDDVILEVNGETINSNHPFAEVLLDYDPGQEITLKIERAGEKIEVKVVLE